MSDVHVIKMNGHDPLLIVLILGIACAAVGYINYRWPTVGASIDVATKVVIAIVGILIFANSGHSSDTLPPANQPAAATPASPVPCRRTAEAKPIPEYKC